MKIKCRKGTRTEIIDSNADNLYQIVNHLRNKGISIAATDYDKGIVILNDGSVIEDVKQRNKFKEMQKYM